MSVDLDQLLSALLIGRLTNWLISCHVSRYRCSLIVVTGAGTTCVSIIDSCGGVAGTHLVG